MKVRILVVGRNAQILETILRLINGGLLFNEIHIDLTLTELTNK